MKKAGYIIALILEIAFYIGAYVFNYYTRRKLGMSRYVVFLNGKIEDAAPIQSIIYTGAAVTVILLIAILAIYMKKREELGKMPLMMSAVSVFTTGLYVYYALVQNTGTTRSYYVVSVCFLAAGLIQNIKTLIGCLVCKKKCENKM